jgi:hypothetical protein
MIQECLDLRSPETPRMLQAMVSNEASDPVDARALGSHAAVPIADALPDSVGKARPGVVARQAVPGLTGQSSRPNARIRHIATHTGVPQLCGADFRRRDNDLCLTRPDCAA